MAISAKATIELIWDIMMKYNDYKIAKEKFESYEVLILNAIDRN